VHETKDDEGQAFPRISNQFQSFFEKIMKTATENQNAAVKAMRDVVPFGCRGPRLAPTHVGCYELRGSHPGR
jgi:hypothetical protein